MTKMNKWKEKRLGELITIKHGFAFSGDFITNKDNNIVLVTPGNFKIGGGFKQSDKKFYSGEVPDEFVLESNEIIITMTDLSKNTDTLGYAALVPIDKKTYLHNQRIGLVKIKSNKITKNFLYWILRTPWYQRRIANTSNGTNVKHTSPSRIYNYKFTLPELSIQKRIADILSNYDDLIENNNRRIALLEKAAQDLYKEWFVRFRFPGHEQVKFQNGLPQGWEAKKLGDIAQFKRGTNITKKEVIQGTIPVIAGGLEPSCFHNRANTKKPVITISASGANAGFVKFNYTDVWASDCSFVDSTIKNIYFVYEILNSIRTIILNLQVGSAQPHVYAKEINKLSIIYPSTAVAEHAEQKLKLFHNKISLLVQQNQNLKKQCDLLLPRLMSGKLEV